MEVRSFKRALNLYFDTLGQLVNWEKSFIFFLNTLIPRQRKIANILGSSVGNFLGTYLGLPLGQKPLDSFWEKLVEKFNKS